MEKGIEFFDAWAKTQKDFLEVSLKSQEAFRSQWLDAMKKTQESFLDTANSFDNPQSKEALKFFNTWFSTVINSSELLNNEVLKIQRAWEKTLESQLEQSKELVKGFSDYLKRCETK